MKTQRLTLPIAIGLSFAALATAQDARPVTATPKPAPKAQDAAPGAAMRPGKAMFAQHTALVGQPVFTSDSGEKPVGMVSDIVIDAKTATATHLIVATRSDSGSVMRALPYKGISWRAAKGEKPQCVLSIASDKLNAMDAFDPSKLDALVGKGAVDAAAGRVKDAAKDLEGKAKKDAVNGAREAASNAMKSMMVTKLGDFDIYAPDGKEPFSTVDNLVLDANTGAVAFATVKVEANTYLVPWQAFKVRPVRTDAGASMALTAPAGAEGMVGAPTVNVDEKRTARNPRFRAEVYKHYGIEEPAPAPAGRDRGKAKGKDMGDADGLKQRADEIKGKVKRKVKGDDGENV